MSAAAVVPKLFQPAKLGTRMLAHRVVMAPLTRFRANKDHILGEMSQDYYGQRSHTPGGLIISEGAFISPKAGGYGNVPGIYNDKQVASWKTITDIVHDNGCRIFCQLWALGRGARVEVLEEEDPALPYISSSAVQLTGFPKVPRALTIPEIKEYVHTYRDAALNAVRAGFDGVELHCANGYLQDQFLQDVCNKRTDEYGGSIENRCRFSLESVEAITNAIGEEKVGIRVSPWGDAQDMHMPDPIPTFSYLISHIALRYPNLAYVHAVEPSASGDIDRIKLEHESNDFLREIWSPRTFISCGCYTRETAFETAEKKGDLIAFGRLFIPNPDLPLRLAANLPLVTPRHDTFYAIEDPHGYIDYPFEGEPHPSLY
ncbi:FMN-linked oxidoreductase [Laetiporus sulphureus 93-53]|uniref:FMN-linked oxidoreductase n=1 Tax=Laetiporus sulphureus 93-53 TaxID=1314785 RepID=A0A165CGK4_9APHY|nr:FMN-linked oxidoreductase [Laetiporus sulphureus 93-53]KZT02769.1 FMN-linked oxidoreductase [Laetiporus sulphureus 93-53]